MIEAQAWLPYSDARAAGVFDTCALRLRALRGSRSIRSFARELDVERTLIRRCELGAAPSLELLTALGSRGVRLDWLVFGSGDPVRFPDGIHRGDELAAEWLAVGPWETIHL